VWLWGGVCDDLNDGRMVPTLGLLELGELAGIVVLEKRPLVRALDPAD
jgi:hypothetical protein